VSQHWVTIANITTACLKIRARVGYSSVICSTSCSFAVETLRTRLYI